MCVFFPTVITVQQALCWLQYRKKSQLKLGPPVFCEQKKNKASDHDGVYPWYFNASWYKQ